MKYKYLKGIAIIIACWVNLVNAENIYDESRNRSIPVDITFPVGTEQCSAKFKCPVVFLSAGYGVSHLKYTFLSKQFNQLGYLVVAIGHELPSDPPLSVSGDLYETRSENWSRGAKTLDFLKNSLSKRFKNYDFEKLMLVGHSNGGDISAWLGNEGKTYIKNIITLDHRRVPLPRNNDIQILSIRASDYPADEGVLPTESEQKTNGSCIVKIPNARHNDIADFGPVWLKEKINLLVNNHLNGQSCLELKKA
jgi:predicted esterase